MTPHEQRRVDEADEAKRYVESDWPDCSDEEKGIAYLGYLAGLRAERARGEEKLREAVEALEESVSEHADQCAYLYHERCNCHVKAAKAALKHIRGKPALTPEQKWAYGSGPGTLAGDEDL